MNIPEPLKAPAESAFSPLLAAGLWDKLLEKLGPVLAELLLDWLLKRQAQSPAPAAALASSGTLWMWVVTLLRSHSDEIKEFLKGRVDELVDLLLASLEDAP